MTSIKWGPIGAISGLTGAGRSPRILREVSTIHHENKSAIIPELEAEFEAAARQAMSSKRDPGAMRRAAERMDRMREDVYREHGLLDIGVPATRELRPELPE
jgi:hypothetical protein